MTRSRVTRTTRLVAPALTVLLLSACGEGPVRTGAAATVGSERILTTELAQVVDRGLADPQAQQQLGADRAGFQRQVLSRLITGDLLSAAAREKNVSVTEGEVDTRFDELARQLGGREQLLAQAAQSGIAERDLRPFIRDLTLNDKLGDRLVAGASVPSATLRGLYQRNLAQYDQVRARHILVKTAPEAQQVLAQVRSNPASFATLASTRSLDEGSKVRGGELDPVGRGAYVKPFENALFAAKPNVPGVVRTEFGYHVYELLERRTTTLQQALPALRREALQSQRETALGELLRRTAARERIVVNPRFGRWDNQTGTVVEADTAGKGSVSSPAPDAPAPGAPAPGGPAPGQLQQAPADPAR